MGQSIAAAGCKKRKWGNHKFTQICKCPRLLARSVCAIEWECVCVCVGVCGCMDCCTCVCTWQRVPPFGLPNQQTLQQGDTNRSSGTTARKCSRPKGNLVELSAPTRVDWRCARDFCVGSKRGILCEKLKSTLSAEREREGQSERVREREREELEPERETSFQLSTI